MRRKKGKRCRRDQKKKRRGGSCREKQRSLERAAARRKGDVAFEGRASKKRDYSWNSRVSYSDFLIAKIMTSWPRRFLSLDVSVGGFRLRGNTRRREDEKGRGRVCFVVGETIFRTNGARGGRWRGSRFAGNVKGFVKEFLGDSYEIYIYGGGGGGWLRDECAHEVELVTGSRWRLMLTTRSCTRARFWLEIMRCSKVGTIVDHRSFLCPSVNVSLSTNQYRMIEKFISTCVSFKH